MNTLDDFIAFAANSRIVIADYESRLAHLEAMVELLKSDDCPMLRKWIADAHRRVEALGHLYHFAKKAETLPVEQLTAIWEQLKELKYGG